MGRFDESVTVGIDVKSKVVSALEYLFGRMKAERPVTVTVGEQAYAVKSDGTIGEPIRELLPIAPPANPTLEVSTLSGLVAAVKSKLDGLDPQAVALRVVDVHAVEVVSLESDKYARRHVWVRAKHAAETKFEFDKYYSSPESFLIAFRSSFHFNDEAVKVAKLCSVVSSGDSVAVTDDGISQAIQVNAGTVTRSTVDLPADGIPLIPWRTFREANPVESKFLLRMKGVKESLPHIALFEIDAKWRVETVQAIATYLRRELPELAIIA